jgi:hypothetical protein
MSPVKESAANSEVSSVHQNKSDLFKKASKKHNFTLTEKNNSSTLHQMKVSSRLANQRPHHHHNHKVKAKRKDEKEKESESHHNISKYKEDLLISDIQCQIIERDNQNHKKDPILYEGEMMKYKPGVSHQYFERWLVVTQTHFLYYKNRMSA